MENPKNDMTGKKKKKENWGVVTFETFYPGLDSKTEAEKFAKSKGVSEDNVKRLKDL